MNLWVAAGDEPKNVNFILLHSMIQEVPCLMCFSLMLLVAAELLRNKSAANVAICRQDDILAA